MKNSSTSGTAKTPIEHGRPSRESNSWQRREATGRVAQKHVDGFKELHTALREGGRQLEDLKQRVPYQDMGQIDSVEKETDQLRTKVLRVLFPALNEPEGSGRPRKQ